MPVRRSPSSGTAFHSLHATSQALQPMHTEVSVKKPIRGGWSPPPAGAAGPRPGCVALGLDGVAFISHLRPCRVGDAGPVLVGLDELAQPRPARAPPGTNV